jgi:hypothetical protein
MNTKFEFVAGDTLSVNGVKLQRIRALCDIPEAGVKAGDLGGYLESEKNIGTDPSLQKDGSIQSKEELVMNEQAENGTYTTVLDSDTITAPPVGAPVPESDNFVSTFVRETVTYNLETLAKAQQEKQKRLAELQAEVKKEKEALAIIASRLRLTQKAVDSSQLVLKSPASPAIRLRALASIENTGKLLERTIKELGIKVPVKKKIVSKKTKKNSTS